MFKYNVPKAGVPKMGFSGGDGFPPGKYLVTFAVAKHKLSENLRTGTAGQPQVITEWDIAEVIRRDYDPATGYTDWEGKTLTAKEGVRRSYVLKVGKYPAAIQDLNLLCALLRGVDTRNPASLRAAGLVAADDSAAELDRVCNAYNALIDAVMPEDGSNPCLEYLLTLTVTESKNPKSGNTFMRHTFEAVTDPAAIEHNKQILAKIT